MAKRKGEVDSDSATKKRKTMEHGPSDQTEAGTSSGNPSINIVVLDEFVANHASDPKEENTMGQSSSDQTEVGTPSATSSNDIVSEQSVTNQKDTIYDQQQSPFMKLPPEIRTMIYEYAMYRKSIFDNVESGPEKVVVKQNDPPSLLHTCCIVRSGALSCFLSKHEPIVKVSHIDSSWFKAYGAPWLDTMPEGEVAQLKTVVFSCRRDSSISFRHILGFRTLPSRIHRDLERRLKEYQPKIERDDVVFRVAFINQRPGFEVKSKIWDPKIEQSSAVAGFSNTNIVLIEDYAWADLGRDALEKHMQVLVSRGVRTFDSPNIRLLARLLVNEDRWYL